MAHKSRKKNKSAESVKTLQSKGTVANQERQSSSVKNEIIKEEIGRAHV